MKYILMIQFPLATWRTQRLDLWPKEDQKGHMEFLKRFNQELVDTGELVRTERCAQHVYSASETAYEITP